MNKTILSFAVGVVFFLTLAFSPSNADVCTISEANFNENQKTTQDLENISNTTNQCKLKPTNYLIRDTYRTRNLNIRIESRKILVDGREQERRIRVRVEDNRRVKLTRSESLPDIRRERNRNIQEREIYLRSTDQKDLERNDRRFLENRLGERNSRRETRDINYERLTSKDNERSFRHEGRDTRFEQIASTNNKRTFRHEARDIVYERSTIANEKNLRREARDNTRFERLTTKDDERSLRRETGDVNYERLTIKDDVRKRTASTRKSMITVKDNNTSTSWPYSNFVQSTIGVLGLYYFGMQNKSTK